MYGHEHARAQQFPDPEIELRREHERVNAQRQREERTPDVKSTPTVMNAQRLSTSESPCFKIKRLELNNADNAKGAGIAPSGPVRTPSFSTPTFDWVLASTSGPSGDDFPIGKCLGAQGIGLVLKRATKSAVQNGFVTTRVLAHKQDLTGGTLNLTLIPGHVSAVRFMDAQTPKPNLVNSLPIRVSDVLQTVSGLSQVNIQTPSSESVTRNTYSQFDVSSKGAILNSSRTDTSTQLGGLVQANPWLATGSARVILNEVNSSNASQLNGYIEVIGDDASVVVAQAADATADKYTAPGLVPIHANPTLSVASNQLLTDRLPNTNETTLGNFAVTQLVDAALQIIAPPVVRDNEVAVVAALNATPGISPFRVLNTTGALTLRIAKLGLRLPSALAPFDVESLYVSDYLVLYSASHSVGALLGDVSAFRYSPFAL